MLGDIMATTAATVTGGDRFETQSSGLPGSWLGTVIATSGYRGTPWVAGLNAYPLRNGGATGSAYAGYLGTVVEPSAGGTFAYIATTAGVVGATEPEFVSKRWSNGAIIAPNELIVPTHANWTGYAYQASGAGGTTSAGGPEPTWPTTIGASPATDGTVTWTCVAGAWGQQAGESTVDGSSVVWTWLGAVATSNNIGFVDDPIIAYEPRARTRLGDGAGAVVTTCVVDTVRAHIPTTNATPAIIETYALPINAAECVDYTVVAKLVGATGSAAWRVTVGAERGGSGAAVLKYNPGASLLWATDGLAALAAGSVAVALSATVGSIDLNATGIGATNIHWEVLRQGIEAT